MPGGGVCAVLDYEVDMMAEYVAEMAVELITPRSAVTPAFRKFCSQILSSTRLPKTTILLGMNYLSKRVNGIRMSGASFHPHEGQVWRMLTIALLLGSKFLDDNTFQNRSWSEVSGIQVAELNKLEAEWLVGIEWNLYVDLDRSQDYNAWLENWGEWVARKKMAHTLASRERLAALVTPIQTDFNRPVRAHEYDVWHQQQVAEYERLSSLKRSEQAQQQSAYRPQEISWNQFSTGPWSSAPLTPPDSGYGTPEYPTSATSGNGQFYGDWFNRAFANDFQGHRYSRQNSVPNVYHHPRHSHYPGYYNGQNIWEMNVAECNCANCTGPFGAKSQQPYFMAAPAYGQAVLG
ncbi:hypothetical protein M406DRAFT_345166 [Cryphonectria parasitica EP155]|uniref:Uncharacterized protein n=1 Tax=Cryphonectria parasitica (strain ATCC 38755 / EP155) TaxID=660469 RepID=A0A9P5CR21_CRYP1|nr:uncharacterized protein M406DRAFT_345166 [Cryphonectria parasitica EP155]KAF3766806.1 hypothetical protein M406DRAFT_345166 [Cryphonectria parasitica EP155]